MQYQCAEASFVDATSTLLQIVTMKATKRAAWLVEALLVEQKIDGIEDVMEVQIIVKDAKYGPEDLVAVLVCRSSVDCTARNATGNWY